MHRGLYGQAKATHRYIPGTSGMSINASMMKSFGKVMGHLVLERSGNCCGVCVSYKFWACLESVDLSNSGENCVMWDKDTKSCIARSMNIYENSFKFHDVFVVSEYFGILEVLQTAPQPPRFSHPEIQPSQGQRVRNLPVVCDLQLPVSSNLAGASSCPRAGWDLTN